MTVTGGTGGITVQWSNGVTGLVNGNLGPGTYTATATDQNGCTEVTAPITLIAPPQLVMLPPIEVDATCPDSANGNIVATATGGTPIVSPPVAYEYSIDGVEWQSNTTGEGYFDNLPAGVYTIWGERCEWLYGRRQQR